MLQKEMSELAHVQDSAQLEQRQIAELRKDPSLDAGPGDPNQRLSKLTAITEDAELNLDHCFAETNKLEAVIKKVSRDIATLKKQLENLAEEKSNLTRWSKDNPGKAQVIVDGALLSGTSIIGKHSDYTVDELIRHARITEILFRSDEGGEERTTYQMNVGNF